MLEKASNMSEQEKLILSLVELLKKSTLHDSQFKEIEHQVCMYVCIYTRT